MRIVMTHREIPVKTIDQTLVATANETHLNRDGNSATETEIIAHRKITF